MKKKNIIILLVAVILFVVALVFCIFVYNGNSENKEENAPSPEENISKTEDIVGVMYKDVTFYKEDNSEIKLSDYKDSPVVILFFNTSNDESIKNLKMLSDFYKNYGEQIKFIPVNTSKDVDSKLSSEYEFEMYYDFYEEARRTYKVTDVPAFIYIDKENNIMNAKQGFTTQDALEANLDILIENF